MFKINVRRVEHRRVCDLHQYKCFLPRTHLEEVYLLHDDGGYVLRPNEVINVPDFLSVVILMFEIISNLKINIQRSATGS